MESAFTQGEPPNRGDEPMSFPAWAFSTVDLLRKTVGIGAVLSAAFAIYSLDPAGYFTSDEELLNKHLAKHTQEHAVLLFIQAVACAFLAVLTPRPGMSWLHRVPNLTDDRTNIAIQACQRIQYFLVIVFLLWSLYYVISAVAVVAGGPAQQDINRVVKLTLSLLTALVIYWLYLEMAVLTVATDAKKDMATSYGSDARLHRVVSAAVAFVLIALMWYPHVAIAHYGGGDGYKTVLNIVDITVGCLSGVALCMVAGRLGSEYINPGSITLGLLYLYGVIQPAAAVFHREPVVLLAATTLALPLKILLWLVCVWAFTSGILGEYAYDLRELIKSQAKRRSTK